MKVIAAHLFGAKKQHKATSSATIGSSVSPSEFLRIAQQAYMLMNAIKDSDTKQNAYKSIAGIIPVLKQVIHDLDEVAYNSDEFQGEPKADLGNNHWAADHGWGD